jgi:hypothetical protein
MNVDLTIAKEGEGRREEKYECFFCKKKGHIKKNCYAFYHSEKGSSKLGSAWNWVTELVDDQTEAEDNKGPSGNLNLRDELMRLDEEARALVLEDTISQGFSMGLN